MHRLRRSGWLSGALLLAFALLTTLAGAAPLVRPVQAFERLCTADGSGRMVPLGAQEQVQHSADCALCVPASALPPTAVTVPAMRARFAVPPDRLAPLWRVVQRNSPPPARAPPQSRKYS